MGASGMTDPVLAQERNHVAEISLARPKRCQWLCAPWSWRGWRRGRAVFGPGVARVATAEFPTNARIVFLPEAGKVARDLHGAVVGRQKVQGQGYSTPADGGP
jgi:hypothetical protein